MLNENLEVELRETPTLLITDIEYVFLYACMYVYTYIELDH
jgi:hypothetical protein